MFRDTTKSKMDKSYFGVGSTIGTSNPNEYLLIGAGEDYVRVVDLETMMTVRDVVRVDDVNYLTANEARKVVEETVGAELGYTYSDFTLNPEGFKFKLYGKK